MWISVEDKPPKQKEFVYVKDKAGNENLALYEGNSFWDFNSIDIQNITHWKSRAQNKEL